jgi:hypothetical protein
VDAEMKEYPIVIVFGRRGCGKTFLTRKLAQHQARVCAWDFMDEYGPMANYFDGDLEGFAYFLEASEGKQFAAARYIPLSDVASEFDEFCRKLWSAGNFVVVIEEAAEVCSAGAMPSGMGRLVRQGRHKGLGILATTQRLSEVSRTLTALASVFVGFSTTEPRDLAALSERTTPEFAEQVKALPAHEFLCWDVRTQEVHSDSDRLLTLWGAPLIWPHQESAGA